MGDKKQMLESEKEKDRQVDGLEQCEGRYGYRGAGRYKDIIFTQRVVPPLLLGALSTAILLSHRRYLHLRLWLNTDLYSVYICTYIQSKAANNMPHALSICTHSRRSTLGIW